MNAFLRDAPLPPLLPADVQQRADAEIGAAWRRCEAALPDGYTFSVSKTIGVRSGPYLAATDHGPVGTGYVYANTPAAALTALAEALEARNEADTD